jgi:hypothetical protein
MGVKGLYLAVLKMFVRKLEGKGLSGKPRRRLVESFKMNLREILWDVLPGLISLRIGANGEPL